MELIRLNSGPTEAGPRHQVTMLKTIIAIARRQAATSTLISTFTDTFTIVFTQGKACGHRRLAWLNLYPALAGGHGQRT